MNNSESCALCKDLIDGFCICNTADQFMKENEGLMQDLTEMEEKSRCLA